MARKILLADDSVTAQNMGRRILTDAGYDVVTVNNGSAALKRVAEQKPDLIVLDVYMPGYGGLEVCQRLKEVPDTSRIPILLTVGKLEPFKPEEARRVQADAFIVKPFEASELLTALTKLEDRIVPFGGLQKSGRYASSLGASKIEDFGDTDNGWKSRLNIPAPPVKHQAEPKPEEPVVSAAKKEEAKPEAKPEEIKAETKAETATTPGLPADITPEEMAAIAAAAAAVQGKADTTSKTETTEAAPAPVEKAAEPAPVAELVAPVSSAPQETVPEVTKAAENPPAATPEPVPVSEVSAGPLADSKETPAEKTAPDSAVVPETVEAEKETEPEVTAALASLVPPNGNGSAGSLAHAAELVPVTMALAHAQMEFTGPRWIAEEAVLAADEAAMILEQEMQKAYAALAGSDAGQTVSAVAVVEQISQPVASVAEATVIDGPATSTPMEPAAEAASMPIGSAPAAEAVVAAITAEVEAISSPSQKEGAAFAASVFAGPETPPTETTAMPGSKATAPGGDPEESQLAAAWEQWKNVRETVGEQLTSQIAEASAQIAQTASSETGQSTQSDATTSAKPDENLAAEAQSSAASSESAAIASIVDSVLADLKPKLMQEIARKMEKGKEKK